MNINDLTLGQIKEIQALLVGSSTPTPRPVPEPTQYDLLEGRFVLVRHHRKGVNCGVLTHPTKEGFYLENGRKFWRWQADEGVSLESFSSSVREDGTRASHIKELIYIPSEELCGIIWVSDEKVQKKMLSLPISHQD